MRHVWERGELLRLNKARIRRLVMIFGLGFALRVPLAAWFSGTQSFCTVLVHWLCTVDILSCLAVALGLLLLLGRIFQQGRKFDFFTLGLAIVSVALAPVATTWTEGNQVSSLLLIWTNVSYGALFPLLPWLGFAALGAVGSRWQGRAGIFVIGAAAAWVASWLVPANPGVTSLAQPDFFLERLSWVLLLGAGFASCRRVAQLKLLQFVGQNSLVLYVIHLQILYAVLPHWGWFTTLPPATAVGVSLPLTLAASLGAAWLLARFWKPRKS